MGWGFVIAGLVAFLACNDEASPASDAAVVDSGTDRSFEDRAVVDAASTTDAGADVEASTDAEVDADTGAIVIPKFVQFGVDYGGPVANATVDVLSPTPMTLTTDEGGHFLVEVPLYSTLVVKVTAPGTYPMIRGIVVGTLNRIRTFYLAGPPEAAAAESLGRTFDLSKGVVEVDFRNVTTGGYGVTLAQNGSPVTPGFGIALDEEGAPSLSLLTVSAPSGSTLLLADVPPGTTTFTPHPPDDAAVACTPCDAPALPVEPGAVTWFDFECGATNCQ
jgi:hypothetical protein